MCRKMDFLVSQKIPGKFTENPRTRSFHQPEVGARGGHRGPRRLAGVAPPLAAPGGRLGGLHLLSCPTSTPIYSRDGKTPEHKSFFQFLSRSRRHPLFFFGRANLEADFASGEGRSSPSSSPSLIHPSSMTSLHMCE